MQSKDFVEAIRVSNQILKQESSLNEESDFSFLEKRLQDLLDKIFMEYKNNGN